MVYNICKRKNFVNLTSSEKLVFIASFMWLMNWGVRISESAITYLFCWLKSNDNPGIIVVFLDAKVGLDLANQDLNFRCIVVTHV